MLKRVTTFMAAMICAFTFIFISPIEMKTEAASFFTGSGTREDPYQISSKSDLKKLAELCNAADANTEYKLAYYIQTADIDLGDEAWTPIGVNWNASTRWEGHRIFGGVYDGKGHTVSGLNVSGGYPYAGLFGRIGDTLQADCRVENLIVKGAVSPTVDSTWSDGAAWVGGITGEMGEGAAISNCSFIGTVSGLRTESVIGGIAGKIYKNGSIYNCSFVGDLTNTELHSVAGIVANIGSGSTANIYNCYATGTLNGNGSPYCGGIVGNTGSAESKSTVKIVNCYFSDKIADNAIRADGWGVTETNESYSISDSDMKSQMADLLGESFVKDSNNYNNGYPVHVYQSYTLKGLGTKANPYQISSKADLFYMSDAVNARVGYDQYYIQTADIDLENDVFTPIGTYTDYNRGWGPGMGFQGCYDGNHKHIYNFNVKRSGTRQSYCGLFGWMYGLAGTSYVKDVVIFGNVESETGNNVGGIVGEIGSHEVTITGCAFIGDITGSKAVGGIAGSTWSGAVNILDCYYNGNVTSTSAEGYAGGIVGRASNSGTSKITLTNGYSVGAIKKDASTTNVGAIIGGFEGETKSSNVITSNCYFSSASGSAVNQNTYNGCTGLKDDELRSCADKLGLPFVNSDNENLNDGYPVFDWQASNVAVKQNVNTGFKGSGTATNPYQISSAKDLNRLAELINDESTNPLFRHAYYIQTADIDLNNEDFTPIGIYYGINGATTSSAIFAGNYDGNYHSIKNLSTSYSNAYCGLFGRVGEYNYDNTNCEIKNLSVSGSVECYSDSGKVGGIVGELAYGATIKNCDYHGLVTSNGKVGSIVGSIYCGGTISACYSDANVSTESAESASGGIVGEISVGNNAATGSANAKVEGTYYNGTISSNNTASTGAICGKINESNDKTAVFETNFFLSSSYNGGIANAAATGCTKLSAVALKACADMIGSPYIQNNDSTINNGYPVFEWQSKPYDFLGTGSVEDPYQISSKAELEQMRSLVNSDFFNKTYGHAYYIQTANIDLKNDSWTPIGIGYDKDGEFNADKVFYGTFNGNGKYIKNLNVDDTAIDAGLFGVIDGAESAKISNLVLYGTVSSASALHGGAIAGKLTNNATIDGCGFVGSIDLSSDSNGTISAGGIVGIITNGGTITNCYHNGKVSSSKNAGGILGTAEFTQADTVTIENCYQANGTITGNDYANSIVGNCIYANSAKGKVNIANCYCTNDTGTSASSKNATSDNTLTLSKSLLKKAFEDLGSRYVENTDSDLNDGYPVYRWQLFTSTLKGDVSGDGEFNVADVVCLQRWLLADKRAVLNCWRNGDLCTDNRIDVFDLCLMRRELLKQRG